MLARNTKKLLMDKADVREWGLENSYANMQFYTASDDYVAARCCILNGLFSGFSIASQAIEKILKAIIFLESGEKMKTGHNPFLLKEKLKKIKDYKLDKYDHVLKKLNDHYLSRYHDNRPTYNTNGASSSELIAIDELWFDLVQKMAMPDEVKFRMKFFGELLDQNSYFYAEFWLKINNKKFRKIKTSLTMRYKEVIKHLYRI